MYKQVRYGTEVVEISGMFVSDVFVPFYRHQIRAPCDNLFVFYNPIRAHGAFLQATECF